MTFFICGICIVARVPLNLGLSSQAILEVHGGLCQLGSFFFNAPTRKQQTPMPHVVRCVSRCKYIMKAIETSMSFGDFPERHGPG